MIINLTEDLGKGYSIWRDFGWVVFGGDEWWLRGSLVPRSRLSHPAFWWNGGFEARLFRALASATCVLVASRFARSSLSPQPPGGWWLRGSLVPCSRLSHLGVV